MENTPTSAEPTEGADELQKLTSALPAALSLFNGLSQESRQKLLQSLATVFGLQMPPAQPGQPRNPFYEPQGQNRPGHFSEDRSISPKDFMLQKSPKTDVERVACLAYYLTHYREQQYFKTLDISKLNTDAAQMKFANAPKSVDNATMYGYLAPAMKGTKQLSAAGELFVRALPDREAAKAAMASARPRKRPKKAPKEMQQDADLPQ
jgi:hypothetical protein